jgi:hypothetical protein
MQQSRYELGDAAFLILRAERRRRTSYASEERFSPTRCPPDVNFLSLAWLQINDTELLCGKKWRFFPGSLVIALNWIREHAKNIRDKVGGHFKLWCYQFLSFQTIVADF